MSEGNDRSPSGFWKTTLGYLTQIGIIVTAIAAIIGGIATLRGGENETSPPTPAPTAAAADDQLPQDCVSELVESRANPGGQGPELGAPIKVHREPAAITVGRQSAWVAHTDGRVTRFPLATDSPRVDPLSEVRVGTAREGQVDIAYGHEGVWVTKRETKPSRGYLAKIESSGELSKRIRLDRADNVAIAGDFVWVTHDDGRLTLLDPSDLSRRREESIGGQPHGLWAREPCMYVATTGGFVVFDTASGKRIEGGIYRVGGAGEIVAAASALWLTDEPRKAVLRVDPERPERPAEIGVGITPAPDALAASDSGIWTADADQTVVRVDPSGLKPEPIRVGGAPVGMAIGGDPELVWVAQRDSNRITPISP